MKTLGVDRARGIVKLAAKGAKSRYVRTWLTWDEKGTWERMAKDYLARVPALMAEKNLTMSDDAVDGEIACMLRCAALEAALNHAKSKAR